MVLEFRSRAKEGEDPRGRWGCCQSMWSQPMLALVSASMKLMSTFFLIFTKSWIEINKKEIGIKIVFYPAALSQAQTQLELIYL